MNYQPIIPVIYVQLFNFYFKNIPSTVVMLETPPKRWF